MLKLGKVLLEENPARHEQRLKKALDSVYSRIEHEFPPDWLTRYGDDQFVFDPNIEHRVKHMLLFVDLKMSRLEELKVRLEKSWESG